MFLAADGESGKRIGDETIRVRADGTVEVNVPAALAGAVGCARLTLNKPVDPAATYLGPERADRINTDKVSRYDITIGNNGRWCTSTYPGPDPTIETPSLAVLSARRTLGSRSGCQSDVPDKPITA